MGEICCGVVTKTDGTSPACETGTSRAARRRRMEIRKIKFVAAEEDAEQTGTTNRQRLEYYASPAAVEVTFPRGCDNAEESLVRDRRNCTTESEEFPPLVTPSGAPPIVSMELTASTAAVPVPDTFPKFGMASVCGRRRDMEDTVAIHPWFCRTTTNTADANAADLHYFAVYDGHGCSHVAVKCRERMHELVKEELEGKEESREYWKEALERSFMRMDKEAVAFNVSLIAARCRCELQTPECDGVGSAAVLAVVTPDKIIVANCGDSRAVLCRNGEPIPLSHDHKPDRPDELDRIQAAGGRVIFWDCPRVQGALAMSRAIGDNYLKPYVSCEPEVTITERTAEDDCLILASDGLWDVVSNDTACSVARMCLRGKGPAGSQPSSLGGEGDDEAGNGKPDRACSDASDLLTKLALARHSADNVSVIVIDLRKDACVD